jgi:hypothetical protein
MATSWTDPTLTVGSTLIKKNHFTEMRTAITTERSRRSLSAPSFTDSTLTAGITQIKKAHTDDVRSAITSFSSLSPTDPTITAGVTPIKAVHVTELRTKINNLENHATVGGTTDCNAGCTGLCVGCTGTCTGGCTSCTSCSGCSGCSSCTGSCSGGCSGCSGDSCSCFPEGTRVLMEDWTEKNIEDIKIGDRVIGIDGNAYNVIYVYETKLGDDRSILMFDDGSLSWSDEHPLWMKNKDNEEYFGVFNFNSYKKEMEIVNPDLPKEFKNFGLKKKLPNIIYNTNYQLFANIDGWKHHKVVIDRTKDSSTKLYDLCTDGMGTIIVNGYVASSFATDNNFDFIRMKWHGLSNKPRT